MSSRAAPTVSVVVGAYNAERWIEETIRSVLRQSYRAYELIVVDDGSTDGTADVARRFGEEVRVIRKANGGSASARNAGIRASSGKYVAFLDADDLWCPRKLESQIAALETAAAAWGYSDAVFFDSSTGTSLYRASQLHELHAGDVLRALVLGNFILTPTVIVRRDVFEVVGLFDETHRISEDWDLWLRVAARHAAVCLRRPLVRVRQHPQRKTEAMDLGEALRSRLALVSRAVRDHPQQLAPLYGRAVANVCVGIGRKWLDREERGAARAVLGRALRYHPTSVTAWTFWLATFVPRVVLRALGRLRAASRRGGRGPAEPSARPANGPAG